LVAAVEAPSRSGYPQRRPGAPETPGVVGSERRAPLTRRCAGSRSAWNAPIPRASISRHRACSDASLSAWRDGDSPLIARKGANRPESVAVARFFHVDRSAALQPGQVLNLTRLDQLPAANKIPDAALQDHVEELFPQGVTYHGLSFLFYQNTLAFPIHQGLYDTQSLNDMRSQAIDLVLEYVRRASFQDRPSRYESIFCWRSRDDATRFTSLIGNAGAPIVEIEGDERFVADMNVLTFGTALGTSLMAHRYWRGEPLPSGTPLWEVFVAPGARVIGRA
jgi:hypothetical protein